jgi:hypothetical protein
MTYLMKDAQTRAHTIHASVLKNLFFVFLLALIP